MGLGIVPVIKFLDLYLLIFLTENRFLYQRHIFNYSANIFCHSLLLHYHKEQCNGGINDLCVHGICTREMTHPPPPLQSPGKKFLLFNISKCYLRDKGLKSLNQLNSSRER